MTGGPPAVPMPAADRPRRRRMHRPRPCHANALALARDRSRPRRRGAAAAGAVRPLVREPRLDAARASAGTSGQGARRPLGAADRADRRRQDAGGISAEPGGVERAARMPQRRTLGLFPSPASERAVGRGWGGQRFDRAATPPTPDPSPPFAARMGGGEHTEHCGSVAATHQHAPAHLHRPRRAPRGRAAHALHLAAQGARGRHRAQPRAAGRRDGAADPHRDPHRRHAGRRSASASAAIRRISCSPRPSSSR